MEQVKITQISAISSPQEKNGAIVFGLGIDNRIYYWDCVELEWVLEEN